MKTKNTKPDTKSTSVVAELKVLGRILSSSGETVSEAISNLKVGNTPKTMGILRVIKSDGEKSRVLLPKQMFRLFSPSKLMREVALKQISQLF